VTNTPARRSPDGFVAQRFPESFNSRGHWLVTRMGPSGLEVEVFDDPAVADWPELHALDEFDAMRARAREWLNQDVDSALYVGVAAERVAAERHVARLILGEDADDRDEGMPSIVDTPPTWRDMIDRGGSEALGEAYSRRCPVCEHTQHRTDFPHLAAERHICARNGVKKLVHWEEWPRRIAPCPD
jgi:hypothetical protein